jgi:5'-nucleotidase
MRIAVFLSMMLALGACAGPRAAQGPSGAVEVSIIAFNDFHGALQPPREAVPTIAAGGGETRVPAGGAAYLASAVRALRERSPNSVVVSAGDLISASQLVSAQFLDEPTILAMNMIGLDFNAVGNHEFDRGEAELRRMQSGGCAQHTRAQPCRVDSDFPGARFRFLAANVRRGGGDTILPAYGIRSFGSGEAQVRVAFIGLTLKETPTLVTPAGVAGLSFADEADTINALIPQLRAEGADAIVVLIHQGLSFPRNMISGAARRWKGTSCRFSRVSTRRWTWSSPATPTIPIFATMAGSIRRGRSW